MKREPLGHGSVCMTEITDGKAPAIAVNPLRPKRRTCLLSAAALCLAAVLLSGCVKKYVRSDIASYAKKVASRSTLTVSEGYMEIQEDEEGYLDHLWTVTDEESGLVFHVLDDYYWAMEEVENQLLNDYDSAAFIFLLDSGKIPPAEGITLRKSDFSGMVQAELFCGFSDLAGLMECYGELQGLRRAAEEAGYPGLHVPYTVRYQNPLRGAVDYAVDTGDTTGDLGSLDGEALSLMKKNYLACALDYRFEDALAEFSPEEVYAVVHAPDSVRIYKAEDAAQAGDADGGGHGDAEGSAAAGASGPEGAQSAAEQDAAGRVYYEGVIGSPKYSGISFGTLYELLRQEGREPRGNAWHFTCRDTEGAELEFSYDFHDLSGFNDAQGRLKKGYYYIRDGRKVRMSAYYANHFDASEIEALTGLKVAEDRPYVTGN